MTRKTVVQATINGEATEFLCEPRQSLLEVLRDVLGLTGAKEGCNNGNCGACNVLLDGVLVNSCLVLGVEAEGRTRRDGGGAGSTEDSSTRSNRSFWSMPRSSAASARPVFWWQPRPCWSTTLRRQSRKYATGWPAISAAAPGMTRSCALCWIHIRGHAMSGDNWQSGANS